MSLGIHGHIAIIKDLGLGTESVIRLNTDPKDYKPYVPIRRASRFRVIGGEQIVQDFGAVIADGQITFSGIKVTQAVAKLLDSFYRASTPLYTIRDWAGHELTAFFQDLTLGPQIDFIWGPDRTATGAGSDYINFEAVSVQVDGFYVDANVRLTDGNAKGDARKVSVYTGSTRKATVDRAWSVMPASSVKYQISDVLHEISATFWILSAAKLFAGAI
jgi:hypothetical protein